MASSIILDLSGFDTNIRKDWIYKDTSFISSDEHKDYMAIQNSIVNLFTFKKGERILLPEYGNDLLHYLYEPINELTEKRMNQDLLIMFEMWEPRVKIDSMSIIGTPDEHKYNIEIIYSIPSLDIYNIAFDFLLARNNN